MVSRSVTPHLLLVACVAGAPSFAHADPDLPVAQYLTDPAALAQRLRENDPIIVSARERVAAAAALGKQARVLPNPELSAALGGLTIGRGNKFAGMTGPTGIGSTSNITVGVSELVELGKRGPRGAAADARTDEAEQQAIATLGARVSEALEVIGKVAYVSARRDVVVANLDAANKLLALEKVRLDHKDLALIDVERIELETKALELQLRRTDSDLAASLAACTALFHAPCSAAGLDAKALDTGAPLPAALPDASAAITSRPLRVASKLESDALHWDATLAEHRAIPDPTFGVSYTYDNYEYGGSAPQSLVLSVGIPLPLFDRGKHDAEAARANARAVLAESEATVREATGSVGALLSHRDALSKALAQLEQESLPSSTRIIEQTRKSFDLGQSGLADLLLVERAHRDLMLDVLDTRFELFEVRAQLREALGIDDDVARALEKKAP